MNNNLIIINGFLRSKKKTEKKKHEYPQFQNTSNHTRQSIIPQRNFLYVRIKDTVMDMTLTLTLPP